MEALKTLFEVLWTFIRVMAPFTPYICELMFRNLRKLNAETQDSVHFLSLPQPVSARIDLVIERRVKSMQYVISAGRVMRDKRTVPMKVNFFSASSRPRSHKLPIAQIEYRGRIEKN